ncbi:MAG: alpha/beta hydrolase [Anaerolineae bacterium]
MNHTTNSFKSADGLNIFTASWLPDSEPGAVVIIVHGLRSISDAIRTSRLRLAEAGYAVYALDHRGHDAALANAPTSIVSTSR